MCHCRQVQMQSTHKCPFLLEIRWLSMTLSHNLTSLPLREFELAIQKPPPLRAHTCLQATPPEGDLHTGYRPLHTAASAQGVTPPPHPPR